MELIGQLERDQIVFPRLGIDINVNETAFTIFGLEIKWYGLLITVGLMLAMIYGFSQMKKYGIDPDRALDAIIGGIVGGLVGARAYYVIMSWNNYKDDFWSVFNIRNGGLAIYGGIIGAIVVGGIIARLRKVKLLPLLDIVSIGFLLGQGIGRWGNFANQEAFGCNTDWLFGMSGGEIQRALDAGFAADKIAQIVGAAGPPVFIPAPAQAAGAAALDDEVYLKRARRIMDDERRYLSEELTRVGMMVYPSQANFLLIRCSLPLDELLARRGFRIRSYADITGLGEGFFGIAVRRRADNKRIVAEIERILRIREYLTL